MINLLGYLLGSAAMAYWTDMRSGRNRKIDLESSEFS